jgi:deoxyribose-phosphate aldolase
MSRASKNFSITAKEMAKYIDHTLLKPEATIDAVAKLCAEAIAYGFKAQPR